MAQYLNAADLRKDSPDDPLGAAIQAIGYGGRIYCPGDESIGPWRPPTKDGWTINKPLEIFGDGRVNEWCGLGYFNDPIRGTADSTIFTLKEGGNHFYLHDIALSNPAGLQFGVSGDERGFTVPKGEGDAIRFLEVGKVVWGTTLERVGILYPGRHCMNMFPTDLGGTTGYWVSPSFQDVTGYGGNGYGLRMRNATAISFRNVSLTQNRLGGLWGHSLDGVISDSPPEGNGFDTIDPSNESSGFYIEDSGALTIRCRFEDFGHGLAQTGLFLRRCDGIVVDGCMFEAPGRTGIHAEFVRSCYFGTNAHYGMETTLQIEDDGFSKDCEILDQKNLGWSAGTGQMIIPPNQSHVRHRSTTLAQEVACVVPSGTISPPSVGQVIYDKPNKRVRIYDGSRWRTIGSY